MNPTPTHTGENKKKNGSLPRIDFFRSTVGSLDNASAFLSDKKKKRREESVCRG